MRRFRLLPLILAVVAIAAYGIAALTGKVASPFKNGDNGGGRPGSNSSKAADIEEMYAELERLISTPDRETDLTGKFTFTTYISGDAQEAEFDEDPGVKHVLQEAWIAREEEDSYFLDVMNLDKPLETDKYYRVTGTVEGSIYWTEDNKKITVLHIIASDAEPFTPPESKANTSATYTAKGGDVEYIFLGAHYTTVMNSRKAIVVYFDFKNNGSTDTSPSTYDLDFYQGNSSDRLSSTIMDPEELDSSALNATKAGITDKTYAGKTSRYYAVYFADSEVTEDEDTLWLVRYNDDYELIDDIGLEIAADLKALQAED